MAIDIRIDQIRIGQLIAEDANSPSKLIVLSNKTSGTELYNGTINDTLFSAEANAADTFFVVSGSKFNVRAQNAVGTNSGVALFTGDVVISGSLVVTTEQTTNYTPILAKSSSFIGINNLVLPDGGPDILNTMVYSAGTVTLASTSYLSVETTDQTEIYNSSFAKVQNTYTGYLQNATGALIGQCVFTSMKNAQVSTAQSTYFGDINGAQLYSSLNDFYCFISTGYYGVTIGNYNVSVTNGMGFYAFGNNNVSMLNITNPGVQGPVVAIGNYNLIMQDTTQSFAFSTQNCSIYSGYNGILGGNNVTIANGATGSLALFAENVVISSSNKIVVGTSNHRTYFSGSVIGVQLSGALNFLSDGSTRAFTTFSTQSGPTHINTASNGQVQFGHFTRVGLGNYISSTATASIPEIAGTAYVNKYEHEDIFGITGSYAKFRCILSTATSSTTAVVKLWNATDGGYVQIGGPGVYQLSTTSSSPTALISSDLTNATLGFSMSNTLYEVHVYIYGGGSPAIVNHHKSELLFAPKTLNGYS